MIGVSLVRIAILTNLAVAHSAGTPIDLPAANKANSSAETRIINWWSNDATEPDVEKVVLRDATLSERCGLVDESSAQPNEETSALADKAHNFVSSIDWIAKQKDPPPAKPDFPIRANWTKRFAAQWDDDGGFSLGGKYVPSPPPDDQNEFVFFVGGFHR